MRKDSHFFNLGLFLLSCMRLLAAITLCSAFLAGSATAVQTGEPQKSLLFPTIVSYDLDKNKITLPKGFAGQTNLVFISFEREQQKDVDTWVSLAQSLQHVNANFRYYFIPTFPPENPLFRWWINSSMRNDESDPETWRWTVPIYVNQAEFRNSLQIANQHRVVTMLVDQAGRVLWRGEGPLTPELKASLLAVLPQH
jgi:hypothetical protein